MSGNGGRFHPSPNFLHGSGSIDSDFTIGGNLTVLGTFAGGSGEINLGANLGTGSEVFANKTGVTLNFRTLIGTGTTNVTSDTNTIIISSSADAGSTYTS